MIKMELEVVKKLLARNNIELLYEGGTLYLLKDNKIVDKEKLFDIKVKVDD